MKDEKNENIGRHVGISSICPTLRLPAKFESFGFFDGESRVFKQYTFYSKSGGCCFLRMHFSIANVATAVDSQSAMRSTFLWSLFTRFLSGVSCYMRHHLSNFKSIISPWLQPQILWFPHEARFLDTLTHLDTPSPSIEGMCSQSSTLWMLFTRVNLFRVYALSQKHGWDLTSQPDYGVNSF